MRWARAVRTPPRWRPAHGGPSQVVFVNITRLNSNVSKTSLIGRIFIKVFFNRHFDVES